MQAVGFTTDDPKALVDFVKAKSLTFAWEFVFTKINCAVNNAVNRIIKEHDLNMIYIAGPGHRGPALVDRARGKDASYGPGD